MANTNNYYQIYVDQVMQLAETIVIKSTAAADAVNAYLNTYMINQQVDMLDPTSWKYYRNLAGEYHSADEQMEVVSLDTLETILFTKENLLIHRATFRGYQYGTRQYRELVTKYPKQESLILGILYPVDIHKAIAAKDGAILGYPSYLVEPNEYTLIFKLQRWIDGFISRWDNKQFGISDALYPTACLGIMYLNLVPAIMCFRLEACKTNEAHSFHVKQYLASHGFLDLYIDNLTLKQALFFYRNIALIERNSGQKNIFEWLVEHIMTERQLPLAQYSMRHDLSKQPTELTPTLAFLREGINGISQSNQNNVATLSQMLSKQDKLARDNPKYKAEALPVIQKQMENSLSNNLLTKMLESEMIDYSKSHAYSLEEIMVNHWLALSASGKYDTTVNFTNPKTGEKVPLSAKDAYTFIWYAFCKSIGIVPTDVPEMLARRVQNIKLT